MKTISKNQFIIFLAVVIILAGVFFVYDLNISKAVYNRTNVFGRVFEVIGEWPNSFALIIGASVIFGATIKKENIITIQSIILFLVSGIGWGGLTLFSWKHFQIEDDSITLVPLIVCGAISLLGDILLLYIFLKIGRKRLQKYTQVALVAILTALTTLVIVNIIKIFWGRMRFREMTDPVIQFTRWLFPQGINGNKSFPSGHSANSATIITLLPLVPLIKDKKSWKKIVIYILVVVWPLLTAVSRVIVGAHFASDTLFGIAITVTIFFILSNQILPSEKSKKRFRQ